MVEFFACFLPRADHPIIGLCTLGLRCVVAYPREPEEGKHRNNSTTMGQIFGKEKPLKEVLRENKRMINRAVRELDREKAALEREEKRLQIEIKKAAKENQMGAVKIMAKVC